jgi:hypothetical protein
METTESVKKHGPQFMNLCNPPAFDDFVARTQPWYVAQNDAGFIVSLFGDIV